jgi:hypothetical protein
MMLEAGFFDLERDGHAEDRAAVLDRDDTPRREAAAIADSIDFVEDRDFRVARSEKITLQRMDVTIFDCAIRGDQSLTDDLPTEYPLGALLGAASTKQVELDLFEIE